MISYSRSDIINILGLRIQVKEEFILEADGFVRCVSSIRTSAQMFNLILRPFSSPYAVEIFGLVGPTSIGIDY